MIKEIIIREDRLVAKSGGNEAGIQGENNAEVLNFTFPEQIAGLDTANLNKYIQFNLDGTTKIDLIQNNQYSLSDELTSQSEIEAQVLIKYENTLLFKSNKFTLTFNESLDNADISITFDDLDIFNTLLDKLKEDSANIIAEIESLKGDYAESNEILQNKIAEVNELSSTLELVLQNANLQISNVEKLVEETNKLQNEIETALSEYDTKTDEKVSEFISTYNSKIEELNTLATNLTDDITSKANSLKTQFDENATVKTNEFNTNVEEQTTAFNQNVTDKQTEFDTNVENKTADFNNTVTEQTNTFNNNVTSKETEINTLAEEKQNEINNNATDKLNEFNENAESYEKRISELEQEIENAELAQQMPWNTTDIQESIHIEDSAKYSRNKLFPLGNLEQETREGYNKFNIETIATNKYLTTNGDTGKSEVSHTSDFIPVTANETYTVFFDYTTLANVSNRVYCLYNADKTVLAGEQYTLANKKITINPTEDGYLRFTYDVNCTNIQCIEGTEKKTYEQYGAMPSIEYPSMPIVATGVQTIRKCNKNLLNTFEIDMTVNGLNFKSKSNGAININGKRNNTTSYAIIKTITYNSPIFKAGEKYSLSYKKTSTTNINVFFWLYNRNQKLSINVKDIKSNRTVVMKEDIYMIKIGIEYIEADTTYDEDIYIQIEKGDTATDCEPHKEEVINLDLGTTELCKITDTNGNVVAQDRAVYRNVDGVWKWQWEKQINKIILNKNLLQQTYTKTEGLYRYQYLITNSVNTSREYSFGVCNVFTIAEQGQTYTLQKGFTISDSTNLLYIYDEGETLSEFKAKVEGTDIVVIYILREAIYEDCTAEQSTVLDKLYKLSLEKGTNNIFVESENGVTTELQLTYMQDLQSKLNALEAMCVSNASQEV